MHYFFTKEKEELIFHSIFLFILSLYYLIPYFLVGQLIVEYNDILEKEIVSNHIIGRLYRGDTESIKLFLAGEIKWYFLWGVLKPLSLLYALFETEVAFWLNDIFVKLIAYISLFKLSRKLDCSIFNATLIACLFACCLTQLQTFLGLGMAAFPYLVYLMVKNKNPNIKHYFLIIFIGLNADLVRHTSIVPMLFLLSYILCPKYQKYNFKIFFEISIILLFFVFLSNANLIYTQLFSEPSARTAWMQEAPYFITNLKIFFGSFFSIPATIDSYWFHHLPFVLYFFPVFVISLFSRNRTIYILLLIVFLVCLFPFIIRLEFIASLRNSSEGLFKTFQLDATSLLMLPIMYGLILINVTKSEIVNKVKYLIYPLLFLSLITFQIRISIVPLGKHFLSFNNLNTEQQNLLKKKFHNMEYKSLVKEIAKSNTNRTLYPNQSFKSSYTFKDYYNYENYKHIKSLVGNSRTISIGLNPMIAVMNNIKVIDGYHNLYPLSYKLEFRKIIEKQLDYYEKKKKYYDGWGNRVDTFVSDPKIIRINFLQAKLLGAEYIISKYPISNQIIVPICKKCNGSSELFLYKIN